MTRQDERPELSNLYLAVSIGSLCIMNRTVPMDIGSDKNFQKDLTEALGKALCEQVMKYEDKERFFVEVNCCRQGDCVKCRHLQKGVTVRYVLDNFPTTKQNAESIALSYGSLGATIVKASTGMATEKPKE